MNEQIIQESEAAFKAESQIVDWMVNGYDQKGMNAPVLKEFIKNLILVILVVFNLVFRVQMILLINQ